MDPEMFDEIAKSVTGTVKTLIWLVTASMRVFHAGTRSHNVFRRLADEQAKADQHDSKGRRVPTGWHDVKPINDDRD